jgi:hypothetical protein
MRPSYRCHSPPFSAGLGVLANSLAVAIALIVGVRPFLGDPGSARCITTRLGLVLPPVLAGRAGLALG